MLLRLSSITVHYGKVAALRGVSLHVLRGEIIALIGANGAGKSTALRTISGLSLPSAGEIWLENQRIDGLPPEKIVALGIAHVPEGKRLFPDMTVGENLSLGAYIRRDSETDRELQMVYEYFPILEERRNQRAGSLSGGEQQMLAIGRALMSKPKLLLMDEPSLGLMPIMVRQIGKIISDINRRNEVSIVLVEQNAYMALKLAHRGYVLETGTIALSGDARGLVGHEQLRKAYLGR